MAEANPLPHLAKSRIRKSRSANSTINGKKGGTGSSQPLPSSMAAYALPVGIVRQEDYPGRRGQNQNKTTSRPIGEKIALRSILEGFLCLKMVTRLGVEPRTY